MPVKVQVGPPQIAVHQGQTVLITEEDGQVNWPSDKGLYFLDTRIVSSWTIYASGEPSDPARLSYFMLYSLRRLELSIPPGSRRPLGAITCIPRRNDQGSVDCDGGTSSVASKPARSLARRET